jgi:HCOMODA/2-hydroxy-3-carboxy-muconic semialdehyde decarboxylase
MAANEAYMTPKGLCDHCVTRRHFVMTSAIGFAAVSFGATRLAGLEQAPASAGAPDPKLIEDLVAANLILADQGIVDGYGHVSVRHDRDPNRYFLSRDLAPALVTSEDIMEYDLDSNPVDAKGRALYLERFIHGEIYKARTDVKAVVHNHSPAVIPFSVSGIPLRPVFHSAAFIVEGVPVFDTRRVPGPPHLLIRSPEAGRALAQTLGSKPAVLILGHGVAVVGTSLPMAVGRSVYLEKSAKIQSQAIALGGQVTELDPEAARELAANDYRRPWELWKRTVTTK